MSEFKRGDRVWVGSTGWAGEYVAPLGGPTGHSGGPVHVVMHPDGTARLVAEGNFKRISTDEEIAERVAKMEWRMVDDFETHSKAWPCSRAVVRAIVGAAFLLRDECDGK